MYRGGAAMLTRFKITYKEIQIAKCKKYHI